MLPGMNATATITTAISAEVLTVPVAALNDNGAETFLYTGYDAETDTLLNPVSVEVGVSDGVQVEISGLEEGAQYYYAYYDTLAVSTLPETGGMFSFRR